MRHRLSLATELNLGYNTRSPPLCQAFFSDFFGLFMPAAQFTVKPIWKQLSRLASRSTLPYTGRARKSASYDVSLSYYPASLFPDGIRNPKGDAPVQRLRHKLLFFPALHRDRFDRLCPQVDGSVFIRFHKTGMLNLQNDRLLRHAAYRDCSVICAVIEYSSFRNVLKRFDSRLQLFFRPSAPPIVPSASRLREALHLCMPASRQS